METTSLPPDDRPPEAGPRRPNRGLLWAAALAVVVLAIATVVAFVGGATARRAPTSRSSIRTPPSRPTTA